MTLRLKKPDELILDLAVHNDVNIECCSRSTVHRHRESFDDSPLGTVLLEEFSEGPEYIFEIHGNSILHPDPTYQPDCGPDQACPEL